MLPQKQNHRMHWKTHRSFTGRDASTIGNDVLGSNLADLDSWTPNGLLVASSKHTLLLSRNPLAFTWNCKHLTGLVPAPEKTPSDPSDKICQNSAPPGSPSATSRRHKARCHKCCAAHALIAALQIAPIGAMPSENGANSTRSKLSRMEFRPSHETPSVVLCALQGFVQLQGA